MIKIFDNEDNKVYVSRFSGWRESIIYFDSNIYIKLIMIKGLIRERCEEDKYKFCF